jgi:hypothetical protein
MTPFIRIVATRLALLAGATASYAAPSWTTQPQVGIGVNIWAPAWHAESITQFDAEKLAESLHRAGATIAFTFQGFSQDHQGMSFFPTELGPMHPNLKGRDFLAEYIAACHRRGIRVFGYYSYIDKRVSDAHPEWRQKDVRGEDIRYALAYSHFRGGNFEASERHLSALTRPELFRKATELRRLMQDCGQNRWNCA